MYSVTECGVKYNSVHGNCSTSGTLNCIKSRDADADSERAQFSRIFLSKFSQHNVESEETRPPRPDPFDGRSHSASVVDTHIETVTDCNVTISL